MRRNLTPSQDRRSEDRILHRRKRRCRRCFPVVDPDCHRLRLMVVGMVLVFSEVRHCLSRVWCISSSSQILLVFVGMVIIRYYLSSFLFCCQCMYVLVFFTQIFYFGDFHSLLSFLLVELELNEMFYILMVYANICDLLFLHLLFQNTINNSIYIWVIWSFIILTMFKSKSLNSK